MVDFSVQVSNFTKKAAKDAENAIDTIAIELFTAIADDTPVDTGDLQSNWYATSTAPSGRWEEQTTRSLADVYDEIENLKGAKSSVRYFTNNAPYAEKIEFEGESNPHWRRPEGMVRVNIARINAKLANGKI